MNSISESNLGQVLVTVAEALAGPGQPQAGFAALDRALGEVLGHKLFTILEYRADLGDARRCYSNQPQAYPVGGRKAVEPTAWTRQVLDGREPYIGSSYEDLRDVFFDHELIRSLGCESVLNLPVVFNARTLGTINLLHEAHWYDSVDVPLGSAFASFAAPGLAAMAAT